MAFWPTSVATNAQLYIAVNALQTTLSGSIDNVVTTITLASTTGFPTAGGVTIDSEVIFYTGISGAQLTGCTRGADGTTAASHSSGVPVGATVIAFHHNGLKDEVIAIESSLNLTASQAVVTNASGRVTTVAVTPTEVGYLAGVTSSIQTQLNATISNPLTSNLAAGSHKITGLADGTAAQDAAAFGQLKIKQIVMATSTSTFTTTSNAFQTTNCSASITPTSSSNNILIFVTGCAGSANAANSNCYVTLFRDALNLGGGSDSAFMRIRGPSGAIASDASFSWPDSPTTTSSITYAVKITNDDNATTVFFNNAQKTSIILIEVAP